MLSHLFPHFHISLKLFFTDRKSQTYFDIMSDFFDEPEVNIFPTQKTVALRHANYRQQPFSGHSQKLRQIAPTTSHVGHGYSEPLQYHNPLDVDHNSADVGFYPGPKYGGVHHNKKTKGFIPQPPPPRPFQPPHRPRLLDDVNHDVDFVDVPKVGTDGEFFGEALRQNSFQDNFSFDESPTPPQHSGFEAGKIRNNFPRPNIGSQFDNGPEQRAPSFTGFADSVFDEPDFDVRQNFRDLRPEFGDVDDGSFNKIEPFPQAEQLIGGRQNFPGKFYYFLNN